MKHPPSKILYTYLVSEGIFIAPGDSGAWPLFTTSTPDKPDKVGTIYDTTGNLDGILQKTGVQIEHYGIQVRIRDRSYEVGWNKAREVYDKALVTKQETVTVGATSYLIQAFIPTTSVVPLGVEEGTNRRELFTVNFIATISEV